MEEKAKKQARQSFEQIHEASARPKNVKDIRDELNMLKAVPKQQNTVQNELHDITTETAKLSGPAYTINDIVGMDSLA